MSKDDLIIGAGTYNITSVKKALNGKDCVKINDCNMIIKAGTDGISSSNDEDADRGFVYIQNGDIEITSGNDGIQAETVLKLANPKINVCAGGGSVNAPVKVEEKFGRGEAEAEQVEAATESEESIKGLKAGKEMLIYLPGAPVSELPEMFMLWMEVCYTFLEDETSEDKRNQKELPFYGIYNVEDEVGFAEY